MALFKIYHNYFIPSKLPIVMYLLYPVIVLGLMAFAGTTSAHPMIGLFFLGMIIIDVECLLDVFCFMGIAGMEKNKLDFLQTSAKGMSILKKGIVADGLRRIFSTTFIILAAFFLFFPQTPITMVIYTVLCTLGITELSLIVIRFLTGIYVATLAGFFAAILFALAVILIKINIISLIAATLLYLTIFAIGRIIIVEKGKKHYYDSFNS